MSESLQSMKRVPHELLQQRLEKVKELKQTHIDAYQIHKDKATGEHYLLYYYEHLLIADNNHKETYYHLMPLETDDVLALILGEEDFTYPERWTRPFLRNSSENDSYVWFDPAHQAVYEQNDALGEQLKQMLTKFKQNGEVDEAAIKKLLNDMDKL
jgi:ABC-type Zn uptake system ZnuABC Zn-binding protein ZnuA